MRIDAGVDLQTEPTNAGSVILDSRNTQNNNTTKISNRQEVAVGPTAEDTCKSNKEPVEDPNDPHAAGTRLGHYVFSKSAISLTNAFELGKSLGKGTFGKVKLAEHILTKEKVAIKILEKARIKDRKDIDRISREIKILKKVRHPNVIQLYEVSSGVLRPFDS
mgnify:CR=1 FL=1